MLAAFTVNSINDDGDGAKTTLREAIGFVNLSLDPTNTINFSTNASDQLNGATINLTSAAGGQLNISRSVTIDASMLSSLTIHAAANSRIFNITGSGTVTLKKLTLTGGNVSTQPDASNANKGGAIYTTAPLTLENCVVFDNLAIDGGGIASEAHALTVTGSDIHNNQAENGGGIWISSGELSYSMAA